MIRFIKADIITVFLFCLSAVFFASCDDVDDPTDNATSEYTYEDEFFDSERVTEVRIELARIIH